MQEKRFIEGFRQTGLFNHRKKARSFKFWICKEERLCYLRSENKGADQLCRHCTADLRLSQWLCFSAAVLQWMILREPFLLY